MEKQQDYKELEFLAAKSQYFIEKQIESYRYKHSISGTIITVIILFIPFFINFVDKQNSFIQVFSIMSLMLLILCIYNFIIILKVKALDFGFHHKKFDELCNSPYETVLLFEIGANRSSFIDNMNIIEKVNKKFSFNIYLTLISIIISIFTLLMSNIFIK